MKIILYVTYCLLLLGSCSRKSHAPATPPSEQRQDTSAVLWKPLQPEQYKPLLLKADLRLKSYRMFSLDSVAFRNLIKQAVRENQWKAGKQDLEIPFPRPDSGFSTFSIYETSVMDSMLEKAYPFLKTYGGKGKENPANMIRFEFNQNGFHAYVKDIEGEWFIQPLLKEFTHQYLVCFFKRDLMEGTKIRFEDPEPRKR